MRFAVPPCGEADEGIADRRIFGEAALEEGPLGGNVPRWHRLPGVMLGQRLAGYSSHAVRDDREQGIGTDHHMARIVSDRMRTTASRAWQ
jgi:hypothetical protein